MIGFEVDKLSTDKFYIYPGVLYTSNYTKTVKLLDTLTVDMTTTGVNGLDVGSPTNNKDYFVYIIEKDSDGTIASIVSESTTYTGVTMPVGYSHVRKLRFGFVYNSSWDGIPNFHASNWPMPSVRFTDSEYATLWMPLYNSKASIWTDLDLSTYLPDNARLVYLAVETRYVSGAAGSGYLRSYTGQSTGILTGSGTPDDPNNGQATFTIRVDSARKIQYKTTGDVSMYIQILGYSMTEPS